MGVRRLKARPTVKAITRGRPLPASTEFEIHKALVKHLRVRARPDVVWFHVPNAPRNKIQGARLKAMGMLAGAPDLIFLHQGKAFALELKSKTGIRVRPSKFCSRWLAAGGNYCLENSLDGALSCLEHWGIIK